MSILSNQFNLSYFQVLVAGREGLAADSFNITIFHFRAAGAELDPHDISSFILCVFMWVRWFMDL